MPSQASPSPREERVALANLLISLSDTEKAPPGRLHALQEALLESLIQHHFATSPAFAERLRVVGIYPRKCNGFDLLNKLPPISRRDIQTTGKNFASTRIPKAHLPIGAIKTSGSTGEPVALSKTLINRRYWAAFTVRDHIWNRRDFHARMSSIRANINTYVQLNDWGPPVNQLFQTGAGQGIPITTPIEKQLELLAPFNPRILLIYPNNLRALIEIWRARGFNLPALKHLKTIGETVSEDLRAQARTVCGREIEDNYSSQEAGPIAIQCPEGGLYHTMSEALIVEVLDHNNVPCVEGQVGRVVVTDLHNFAAPLIRYDIGDYAERGPMCSCGKTLPTLRRILGRERNLIKMPNGDRFWPLVGFHHFDEVVPVRQYQFIQHTTHEIEFKIATDTELTEMQEKALLEICSSALGKSFKYRITQSRGRLPLGANGKFEEFVCRVA